MTQASYRDNVCEIKVWIQKDSSGGTAAAIEKFSRRPVKNIRNCDIYVDDYNFLLFADVQLFKFRGSRKFDLKSMKDVLVKFNSDERSFTVCLPCVPQPSGAALISTHSTADIKPATASATTRPHDPVDEQLKLWRLKSITKECRLQIDDISLVVTFEADYGYGFASRFKGPLKLDSQDEILAIPRMPDPYQTSPLKRAIDRELDDLKNFSADEYKVNFVELQVADGCENPLDYASSYEVKTLSQEEQCLLHNLTRTSGGDVRHTGDRIEIECGLIDILLAICYDIRTTSDEPTCESGWTRAKLSATLSYFQPFDNLRDVVISFLRLSLIYPLYRNFNFSRLCIHDAIDMLQKCPSLVMKQLLITHKLFATGEPNRNILNRYYIEDYIRYVSNDSECSNEYLRTLAFNLRNVLFDVSKKHLNLDLASIECELIKELITDMQHGSDSEDYHGEFEDEDDDDDDDDDDDEEEEDDDVDDDGVAGDVGDSSSTDTEENSVIEQRMGDLKI